MEVSITLSSSIQRLGLNLRPYNEVERKHNVKVQKFPIAPEQYGHLLVRVQRMTLSEFPTLFDKPRSLKRMLSGFVGGVKQLPCSFF